MKVFLFVGIATYMCFAFLGCTDSADNRDGGLDEAETFEKPSLYQYDTDEFFYRLNRRDGDVPFTEGSGAVAVSRKPIVQTKSSRAFWLYEDDPFVMDIGYTLYNEEEENEVLGFDFIVLLDFQPVDFKIHAFEGEGAIPSTSELMEDSGFDDTHYVEMETNKGFHKFSLAIPEDSFPERAAYDMRVVALPRFAPDDEATVLSRRDAGLGLSFSVYYGSTDVREQELPEARSEGLIVPSAMENNMMVQSPNRMFLRPPSGVYDLDVEHQNDLRLGQVFDVEESTPEVHALAWHRGADEEPNRPMIMAFDGTDILEQPHGRVEIPYQPHLAQEDADPFVAKMPVELDIQSSSEPHEVRVMRFSDPLERRTYDTDENVGGMLEQPSPPLFLRRAGE